MDLELNDYKNNKPITKKLELNESPDYLINNIFQLNGYKQNFQTCNISYLYKYNSNKNHVTIIKGEKIGNENANESLAGTLILIFFLQFSQLDFILL